MEEILKSIIKKDNIAIHCKTAQECKELVELYRKYINEEDTTFNENLQYVYGSETCIYLDRDVWGYGGIDYFEREGYEIVSYESLINGYNPCKIRGFEIVSEANRKFPSGEPKLPTRGTSKAMAYDFYAPTDYVVAPNEIVKIWTDVKAYMQDTEGLILNVRSSMGGKFMLANTQGWIDADYYNNENNEGNIGIFLKNISDVPLLIQKGERIAQGMFVPFLVADNGNTDRIREGGFGHTNDTPKNS